MASTKRNLWLACCLFLLTYQPIQAQTDSIAALRWVESQANRIDNLLSSAIRSQDPIDIVQGLTDAYKIFDAITMSGFNCVEIREAAHRGRTQTDILNYRLEKDINSIIVRGRMALIAAEELKKAVTQCAAISEKPSESAFSPADIIRYDALMVELDLTDGLAAENFHILSQKLEHAIRVLYDIRNLAATLTNCTAVSEAANSAIQSCESAVLARNSTEINQSIAAALASTHTILSAKCQ
jgi:hypothetical protein